MRPAIQTFALEKSYSVGFWHKSTKYGLRPLTLTVEEGEIFGYLGPNGAGKTTTLKLLMGLLFPTGGSAKILGMDIGDPRMKAQIGFQPEQPYFYDYLTAPELLHYYAKISGIPAGDRKRSVESVLQRVGLTDVDKLHLRKFSKGMLQRVGLAQAIIHDPKVVFLDEPMSGLDPIGRREVRDLIQTLKDEGKTVFFSTHILSDAEACCDRVAVLNKGELRGVGVVADLTSKLVGQFEVIWEGTDAGRALADLGCECRWNGEIGRVMVSESRLNRTLEELLRNDVRIISVNPVRSTVEDYFVERLSAEPEKVNA